MKIIFYKIIHQVVYGSHDTGRMIVWETNRKKILIDREHFKNLIEKLLQDQNSEYLNFYILDIAMSNISPLMAHNHKVMTPREEFVKFQKLLNDRLLIKVRNGEVDFSYSFIEQEARERVRDYLKSYELNTGNASFLLNSLHDETDEIVNITPRKKPTLAQKLTGKLGDTHKFGEIVLRLSEIVKLKVEDDFSGFTVYLTGKQYHFGEDGITPYAIGDIDSEVS